MFYASRFMTTLSELETPLLHHRQEDEEAMFDAVKRAKKQGLKPLEGALTYFVTQAESGIAAAPDKWIPMTRQAARRLRQMARRERACLAYAERLFDLLRAAESDEG